MRHLDSIIKRVIRESLENLVNTVNDDETMKNPNLETNYSVNYSDFIDTIDDDTYKKLYVDYLGTHSAYGFNPLSLDEGLIHTYPINKTIEYIKKFFNLSNGQIRKIDCENELQHILVYIPDINVNEKLVTDAFDKCGYHLGHKEKFLDRYGNPWNSMQFEAKFQKDESLKIRKEELYLYHLTPKYNKGKIVNIGFSPRCKNELFNYPSRTYFLRGTTGQDEIFNLGQQLYQSNSSLGNNGEYILFKIDLRLVPQDVKFFIDPNYPYGIFTSDYINPNVIVNQEVVKF